MGVTPHVDPFYFPFSVWSVLREVSYFMLEAKMSHVLKEAPLCMTIVKRVSSRSWINIKVGYDLFCYA